MPTEYAALIQFIKYAIAGGIATIAHITIFHLRCLETLSLTGTGRPCRPLLPAEDPCRSTTTAGREIR